MTQTSINQRLKILIKALNVSSRAFSAALDVSDANTRNYLDRGSKPNSDYLERIITKFESVNPTWLLTGRGEMFLTPAGTTGTNTIQSNTGQAIGVNHGTATYQTLADCEKDLATVRRELEQLKQQLASKDVIIEAKDALIAAKEEMLILLRGGHNRPN